MPLLTRIQLANRLNVSPFTIRNWTLSGLIPVVRLGYRTIRYDWDAVRRAMNIPDTDSTPTTP